MKAELTRHAIAGCGGVFATVFFSFDSAKSDDATGNTPHEYIDIAICQFISDFTSAAMRAPRLRASDHAESILSNLVDVNLTSEP
jgi:hypothetical protein